MQGHDQRLAILYDYAEEHWPSMDLCAEMLTTHLQQEQSFSFQVTPIQPRFYWQCKSLPVGNPTLLLNGDRALNRYWHYPHFLRQQRPHFDWFHIADHSYAHLVHSLPAHRTGVFCHDLDTFRCLLQPQEEPRPRWFRWMSQRILQGLQQAAIVFYSTESIRQQILGYGLIDASRLVHAPYGIQPELWTEPSPSLQVPILNSIPSPFVLHVGSCIPRKRIDVLLEIVAALRHRHPAIQLVKVGGEWTPAQHQQIDRLQLQPHIVHCHHLSPHQLAFLYRRAALVLVPSETEGFGLPLIEALASGAIAIASDIPTLREVGGSAAVYCPVGEVATWVECSDRLLTQPHLAPALVVRHQQASRYSWAAHAGAIARAYHQLWQSSLTANSPKQGCQPSLCEAVSDPS